MRLLPLFLALALAGLTATPAPAEIAAPTPGPPTASRSTRARSISAVRPARARTRRVVGLQFQIKRLADGKIDVSVPPRGGPRLRGRQAGPEPPDPRAVAEAQRRAGPGHLRQHGARPQDGGRPQAALGFLDRLGADSEVGLILFDHLLRVAVAPGARRRGQGRPPRQAPQDHPRRQAAGRHRLPRRHRQGGGAAARLHRAQGRHRDDRRRGHEQQRLAQDRHRRGRPARTCRSTPWASARRARTTRSRRSWSSTARAA